MTGPLTKIVFIGNGYIDSATVQKYALYRCAEVAKERNAPYFVIYETLAAASVGRPADMPTVGSVGNKPTAFAFVLFLNQARPNARDTAKTLDELDELVKKGKPKT